MPKQLTPASRLENLEREAKDWLAALRANDAEARARFERAWPGRSGRPVLRDLQHALAREYGFENWIGLKAAAERPVETRNGEEHERAARDFAAAYLGDEAALERLNRYYARAFSLDDLKAEIWRRDYAYRQRAFRLPENFFPLEEARIIVAQDAGFGSWEKLMAACAGGWPAPGPAYVVDSKRKRIGPSRRLPAGGWDEIAAVMKERRIPALDANGMMTDEGLGKIAALDFVTSLSLGGSRELSDDGLLQLTRMPQLESLELNEYPGGKLTDRGLEALSRLPNLRNFKMTWQAGISDRGVSNLRFCERLEEVDLMGSPTGNGAIEALQNKPGLRRFSTGRLATDEGIRLLRNFPRLRTAEDEGARLLIDGPFTDAGLESLGGLDGIFDLDLFWHVDRITPDGFAHLARLANLQALGCDGKLSGDAALRHIARLPRLKRLRIQESVASEDGFAALAASQSIEGIWGRVCPNFGSRGFTAFSRMPALRSLGIGCAKVDAAALAALPEFPALRDLTPIGFEDSGFRYIGQCEKLERLSCMYCRETGDAATEHIAGLRLKYYYAGLTQITDRSLQILGGMDSLEEVEFYQCAKITGAGIDFLARLPALREAHFEGLPGVTAACAKIFPARVQVYYSP